MVLVWRQDISVGDDQIDDDHKGLIAIINAAEDVINGSGSRRDLEKVLERLERYTREHFAREEELQRQVGYPFHEAHVLEHKNLIRTLAEIRSQVSDAKDAYSYENVLQGLVDLLEDWLMNHVMLHDLRMRSFVGESKDSPEETTESQPKAKAHAVPPKELARTGR